MRVLTNGYCDRLAGAIENQEKPTQKSLHARGKPSTMVSAQPACRDGVRSKIPRRHSSTKPTSIVRPKSVPYAPQMKIAIFEISRFCQNPSPAASRTRVGQSIEKGPPGIMESGGSGPPKTASRRLQNSFKKQLNFCSYLSCVFTRF